MSNPETKRKRLIIDFRPDPDVLEIIGVIERVEIAMRRRKQGNRTILKVGTDSAPTDSQLFGLLLRAWPFPLESSLRISPDYPRKCPDPDRAVALEGSLSSGAMNLRGASCWR